MAIATTPTFPLQWPEGWKHTDPANRLNSDPFKMAAGRVIGLLANELKLMRAEAVVISSNVPYRGDGMPYADAARRRIEHPGVALYFTLQGRQMVMAQDRYWKPEANMRSLGLAVEAMRALERHGGGAMMERAFSGFAALPPPDKPARTCWEVLGVDRPTFASAAVRKAVVEAAFREKIAEAHPDKEGGNNALAAELNAARASALAEIG